VPYPLDDIEPPLEYLLSRLTQVQVLQDLYDILVIDGV
jgi:hypothetical protein